MFDWKWRLGARVSVWGVVVGLLCAVVVAALCAGLYFGLVGVDHILHPDAYLDVTGEADDDPGIFEFIVCVITAALVGGFAPRWFLVGALCGFYAPASSLNPFRSPFLWRVIRSTLLWESIGFLATAVSSAAFATISPLWAFCIFLLLELICFGVALWHSLNRALGEEKARLSVTLAPRFDRLEPSV